MFLRQKHVVNSLMKLAPGRIISSEYQTVTGFAEMSLWFVLVITTVFADKFLDLIFRESFLPDLFSKFFSR